MFTGNALPNLKDVSNISGDKMTKKKKKVISKERAKALISPKEEKTEKKKAHSGKDARKAMYGVKE